jgi:hypothetical protein
MKGLHRIAVQPFFICWRTASCVGTLVRSSCLGTLAAGLVRKDSGARFMRIEQDWN